MGKLQNIWKNRWVLASPFSTIWFYFRHLPLRQAIKLPIILNHSKIHGKGKYIIEGNVRFGMIKLGIPIAPIFREKGIVIENFGTITFKGKCAIGGGSGISCGGTLVIGKTFCATTGLKLICSNKVSIGKECLVGWNVVICDTDYHSMKSLSGGARTKGYGEIVISDNVWLASYCKVFKNSIIPSKAVVSTGTFINKPIECDPGSLIYSPTKLMTKHTGYYLDINDDKIVYQ